VLTSTLIHSRGKAVPLLCIKVDVIAQHFNNLNLKFLYVILYDKLLCLTETYVLYELDKHIGMTTVKLLSNENLMFVLHGY